MLPISGLVFLAFLYLRLKRREQRERPRLEEAYRDIYERLRTNSPNLEDKAMRFVGNILLDAFGVDETGKKKTENKTEKKTQTRHFRD